MNKMFTIKDISGQNSEISSYASQFLPYAQKRLGFNKPVGVNFISDPENAKNPLGKTAYYDPNKMEITIFVDKRHVKDILRSLSHELVHHSQNCRGDFDSGVSTEPGYAQKDPHMRKMEAEAYLLGNGFLFRDWEDQLKLKENKNMREAVDMKKADIDDSGEVEDWEMARAKAAFGDESDDDLEEAMVGNVDYSDPMNPVEYAKYIGPDRDATMSQNVYGVHDDDLDPLLGGMTDPEAEMSVDPEQLEEELVPSSQDLWDDMMSEPGEELPEPDPCENWMGVGPCPYEGEEGAEVAPPMIPPDPDRSPWLKNESWRKGNKDRLMFETLMKKWCK